MFTKYTQFATTDVNSLIYQREIILFFNKGKVTNILDISIVI